MDAVLAAAITKVAELPLQTQREIGVQLLGREAEARLPVIEFGAE
jgi:hypothetical protein